MGHVFESILDTIGNTPLLHLGRSSKDLPGDIFAKLEMFNPGSSVKDRIALSMIDAAEQMGLISPGRSTIIEPTSGNTGIGLALVAVVKGYHAVIVLPDNVSPERAKILRAMNAEVVVTPGALGLKGAIDEAKKILAADPNAWSPMQIENPANPYAHESTTGPEIWRDLEGRVDIFVCGVGTGGTLCGTARYLRSKNPAIKVIAVEPASCPLLSGGSPSPHAIQGLLGGFIAETVDRSLIDEIITVTDNDAFNYARRLLASEGLFCGISAGAAFYGALQIAERAASAGKRLVTLFPDAGERYLSTDLWKHCALD